MAHWTLGELRRQLDRVFDELAAERAAAAAQGQRRLSCAQGTFAEAARRLLEAAERGYVVPHGASRDPAYVDAVAAFIADPDAFDEA